MPNVEGPHAIFPELFWCTNLHFTSLNVDLGNSYWCVGNTVGKFDWQK